MASKTVTVLTVHGRRQNVKVDPNTTMLEVLEQVCRKFNFEPAEYDLKHHNKIVDLSAMFRFSGLPNNVLLEMVPATKIRTEADIMLVLQLEDGTRLDGTFKPSTNLLSVLESLCKEKANAESNPVMIYMRREVLWDALDKTTLKSLGLTGGRAIIRLLQRKPEELKTQANVSAPLPQKEKLEEEDIAPRKKVSSPSRETVVAGQVPTSSTSNKEEHSHVLAKKPKDDHSRPQPGPSNANPKSEPAMANTLETLEKNSPPMPAPEINILGDRDAVLFDLETAEHGSCELPDSFYDVTVKDVRIMYTDLRNKVKELEEQPLMTSGLRKLEDEKRVLNNLARYRNTIIRVQFPDRFVLQGIFKLHETVADVIAFVQTHLEDQFAAIHLYTTPPKTILSPDLTLVEAKCVPQAILHVGFDGDLKPEKPLKSNLYEQLSNATGATELATRCRKNINDGDSETTSSTSMEIDPAIDDDIGNTSGAGRNVNRIPNQNFRPSSVQSATTSDVKMPKWFKMAK